MSNREQDSLESQSGYVYEVYAYRTDPDTKLSPWLRVSRDPEILSARDKAYRLHKAKLYDRIEIQQKPAGNANGAEAPCRVVKTYSRGGFIEKMGRLISLQGL